MALADDLRDYMARHGQEAVPLSFSAEVVIVGETHGFLKSDRAAIRTTAMTRVLRALLSSPQFRYFGNESFLNAGPVRRAIRDYWVRGVLPPAFMAGNAADEALDGEEIGRRVMPRRFKPELDDLKAKPKYILSIGSRSDGPVRDRRLAQHFFEEVKDRGLSRQTPGVLLVGAAHSAAVPFDLGQTTMRAILEDAGYRCVTIRIITDFGDPDQADDQVFPLASGDPPGVNLGSLSLKSPISFSTRHATSPFDRVREAFSDSGRSMADQYEFIVLHKS